MIVSLRHLLGWMVSAFRSREDLVLENLALRQQLLALARAPASPSIDRLAQAVLRCVENVLVRVEEASHLGHSQNRVNWHRTGFVCIGFGSRESDK